MSFTIPSFDVEFYFGSHVRSYVRSHVEISRKQLADDNKLLYLQGEAYAESSSYPFRRRRRHLQVQRRNKVQITQLVRTQTAYL